MRPSRWVPMVVGAVLGTAATAGCGDSDGVLSSGPATVEVRSDDGTPASRSVCIAEACSETDGDGRFTVEVDAVVPYEVLVAGEEDGFGTSGEIGPEQCVLITYGVESIESDLGGCEPDDG